MHSRATDRRSASKCQGKWPDQTLDQAFGLREVLVASHISRLASRDAAKSLLSTLVSESSGECRIEALYCFHQNNECSKCEVVHTQRRRTLMKQVLGRGRSD